MINEKKEAENGGYDVKMMKRNEEKGMKRKLSFVDLTEAPESDQRVIRKVKVRRIKPEKERKVIINDNECDDASKNKISSLNDWIFTSPKKSKVTVKPLTEKQRQEHQKRYFQGKIFLNRLCESSTSKDEVSFKDLVIEDSLESVLLTTFNFSFEAVNELFPKTLSNMNSSLKDFTIICHYNLENYAPGIYNIKGFPKEIRNKINLVFPHFPIFSSCFIESNKTSMPTGLQHSKLILLKYEKFVRIIISSRNVSSNFSSQVIFVADVSKEQKLSSSKRTKSTHKRPIRSKFCKDLTDFLSYMRPRKENDIDKRCLKIFKEWITILESCNYSKIEKEFSIIYSIPCELDTEDTVIKNLGLNKLSEMLEGAEDKKSIQVDSYSSSLGLLDDTFLTQFTKALGISVQNFHIIWPTVSQILQNEAIKSKSCMFMTQNSSLFKNTRVKKEDQRFSFQDNFKPLVLTPERRNYMLHAKVLVGYNEKGLKFAYIGSHNLSRNAWGCIDAKKQKYICCSYELGIFTTSKRVLDNLSLPFKLINQTYKDLAVTASRKNNKAEESYASTLYLIGNRISTLGSLFKNISLTIPYNTLLLAKLRKASHLNYCILHLLRQNEELELQHSNQQSHQVLVVFTLKIREFIEEYEPLSSCKTCDKKLIIVDLNSVDLATKLQLFSLSCKDEKIRSHGLPFGLLFDISTSDLSSLLTKDILPTQLLDKQILNSTILLNKRASLIRSGRNRKKTRFREVNEKGGIYLIDTASVKRNITSAESCKLHQILNNQVSNNELFPVQQVNSYTDNVITKDVSYPQAIKNQQVEREKSKVIEEILDKYDTLIFTEIYTKASVYNFKTKPVKLNQSVISFLHQLFRAKSKKCLSSSQESAGNFQTNNVKPMTIIFYLNFPQVSLSKEILELENGGNPTETSKYFRRYLYKDTLLEEKQVKEFRTLLEIYLSSCFRKYDNNLFSIEFKTCFCCKMKDVILPTKRNAGLLKDRSISFEWDWSNIKPKASFLGKFATRTLYFTATAKDISTARYHLIPALNLKSISKLWKDELFEDRYCFERDILFKFELERVADKWLE